MVVVLYVWFYLSLLACLAVKHMAPEIRRETGREPGATWLWAPASLLASGLSLGACLVFKR